MSENTNLPGERLLGTARTAAERRVEAQIATVPEWQGRAIHYAPVHGGLQNSNWRVRVEGDETLYFVKLPGAGTEAFIDRQVAHEAGVLAGEMGIGPRMVRFDAEAGVEIIEYLEGYRACTNGDLKRVEVPIEIAQMYRKLHQAPLLSQTKTIFDMVEEHMDQAEEHSIWLPDDFPLVKQEYDAAKEALLASGLDLVPCHNDPMPGNFLIKEGAPMKLVDYEFASNNDRAYEIAILTTEMFYDDEQIGQVLASFFDEVTWQMLSRVRVFGALADVKWGLWGCVNQQLSDGWDFDYHKYGVWKLNRARTVMADPRWGLWLSSV